MNAAAVSSTYNSGGVDLLTTMQMMAQRQASRMLAQRAADAALDLVDVQQGSVLTSRGLGRRQEARRRDDDARLAQHRPSTQLRVRASLRSDSSPASNTLRQPASGATSPMVPVLGRMHVILSNPVLQRTLQARRRRHPPPAASATRHGHAEDRGSESQTGQTGPRGKSQTHTPSHTP